MMVFLLFDTWEAGGRVELKYKTKRDVRKDVLKTIPWRTQLKS